MSPDSEEDKIPDWLKNLQENSWELELLVSGGAIFSLIQMSDLYLEWIKTLKITTQISGIGVMQILGMFGIKILTTGFILHLILRAFWLGLVCVNYVFPGGINGEKLNFKKPFKTKHLSGDLKEQIMKVDKLCGKLMYTSIISAVALIGITFLLFCVIGFIIVLESNLGNLLPEAISWITVVFFWLYVFDLLFSGILRKIPFLTYLFFPFFKIFDFLSFRFLYQRSLNLFSSNINKINFFVGALIFTAVSVTSTYLAVYRAMKWPNLFDERSYKYQLAEDGYMNSNMYRDEMSEDEISVTNIQSKIIEGNCIDLFIRYDVKSDQYIQNLNRPDSSKTFSQVIDVFIDDSLCKNISWYSKWNKEVTNIGVSSIIDISHLSFGYHLIKVEVDKTLHTGTDTELTKEQFIEIPFYKDS